MSNQKPDTHIFKDRCWITEDGSSGEGGVIVFCEDDLSDYEWEIFNNLPENELFEFVKEVISGERKQGFLCIKCDEEYPLSSEEPLRRIQLNPEYAVCQSCFDGETCFTCEMCGNGLASEQVDYSNGWREWWCVSCCEDQKLENLGDNAWHLNWTEKDFLEGA